MATTTTSGTCYFLDALPVEMRIHIYEYILFEKGNFFSLDGEVGNSVAHLFPKLRSPKSRRSAIGAGEPLETGRNHGGISSLLLTSRKV